LLSQAAVLGGHSEDPGDQGRRHLVCAAWKSQSARDERALSRHGQDPVVRCVLCERAAGIPVQDDGLIKHGIDGTSNRSSEAMTIIDTHPHPDHIGSNDYFPASVEVVAHENTQKWMAANPRVASNPAAMPDRTFADRMTLGSGDDRIELYYFGAGHTNGDAFIVFPARRAMAAGDIFAWKMAPLIDPMAGGSVLALPGSLEKALKGLPNVDTVIEG